MLHSAFASFLAKLIERFIDFVGSAFVSFSLSHSGSTSSPSFSSDDYLHGPTLWCYNLHGNRYLRLTHL